MAGTGEQEMMERALERIGESMLPRLSMMLDSLLDAASLAQPGFDADAYATEIRAAATELDSMAGQLAAISPARSAPSRTYRAA
jgi:hypothetical protein